MRVRSSKIDRSLIGQGNISTASTIIKWLSNQTRKILSMWTLTLIKSEGTTNTHKTTSIFKMEKLILTLKKPRILHHKEAQTIWEDRSLVSHSNLRISLQLFTLWSSRSIIWISRFCQKLDLFSIWSSMLLEMKRLDCQMLRESMKSQMRFRTWSSRFETHSNTHLKEPKHQKESFCLEIQELERLY